MKPIPYGKQDITQEDINAVVETLQSEFLTQGPKIKEFEKKFAEYIGSKYAVAVSNGTAALHLSAMAMSVNEKSKVITTPITFAASANCIRYCGGTVDFVDVDPTTVLIDYELLEFKLKNVGKGFYNGVVAVDFAGMPLDLEALRRIADKYGLWIIEDACHAPGGYFTDSNGTKQFCGNGRFAELAIFSFHPVKHIACGEGGMITTNNEDIYKKLLLLRTHGITKDSCLLHENHGGWYYEMQELGYNYRLTDFQAALGISQLVKATMKLERRKEIAAMYDEAFKKLPFESFAAAKTVSHAYHLYVIQTRNRKDLYNYLRTKNIFCQVHYVPVHLQPYYQKLGFRKGMFPNAENYYEGCLSLPMYPSLSDEEIAYTINTIKLFYESQ